jgi:hypothetical protein
VFAEGEAEAVAQAPKAVPKKVNMSTHVNLCYKSVTQSVTKLYLHDRGWAISPGRCPAR